jgi:flagellar hook assembly protein FlgD
LSRPAVAVFLLLVGATFGAFFAAQRLKGATPIVELRGAKSPFSPNGDGVRDVKRFGIAVRKADDLTVDIVDSKGNQVRRLVDKLHVEPFRPRRVRWDGRSDDGQIAPDGFYQVRVTMNRTGLSVLVPAKLRIDTRPPRPYVRSVGPAPVLPTGAGDVLVRVARISRRTPATVSVWRTDLPEPKRVAEGQVRPGLHRWHWDGKVDGAPAPAGTYLFQVAVRDAAGNLGRTPARVQRGGHVTLGRPGLTIRSLAAEPPIGPVTSGQKVSVTVLRHEPYTWQLRRVGRARPAARGRGTAGKLTFKAPAGASGLYLLQLQAGTAHMRVPILVQAATRAKVLVVVPMLSWLGAAQVDDNGDGLPDTLPDGGPASWPRPLNGLPAGLVDDVAPLLVFLDRAKVRYDLTSDLALAIDGRGPRATDRPGVLLAGAETWIPPAFARRLHSYVADGGRVATIGTESLRRGVTLVTRDGGTRGRLVRPTQPIDRDPFGARLRKLRTLPAGTELKPIAGSATAPLLTFWDGTLGGFKSAEESEPPAAADKVGVVAGVGVEPSAPAGQLPPPPRPAITQVTLGKGLVIRIGLPGWSKHLGDPDVAQLTRNAIALLAHAKPKPTDLG